MLLKEKNYRRTIDLSRTYYFNSTNFRKQLIKDGGFAIIYEDYWVVMRHFDGRNTRRIWDKNLLLLGLPNA